MKKRILFISHSSGTYGAERCLISLVRALDKDRYDITVACPKDGPLIKELERFDVNWTYLPTSLWIMSRFRLSRSILKLPIQLINVYRAYCLLKSGNFDLVHCNSIVSLEGAIAAKLLSLPVVIHCRELLKDCPYGFFLGWKKAYRLVECFSDKLICISKSVQHAVHEAGVNADKTVVIYDTFELPHIMPNSLDRKNLQGNYTEENIVIGCVAQISPRKDPITLLQAFSIVKRSIPKSELIIIGDGRSSYVNKVKALASKLGIDSSTKFVGHVSDPGAYYRNFALLTVPSYAEPFGLVYGEAALYGIPAIGTSSGGAKEIIEDGVTGFIVPPKEPKILARAMLKILKDPELAKNMGIRAKERVQLTFTLKDLVESVEKVYEEVLIGKNNKS